MKELPRLGGALLRAALDGTPEDRSILGDVIEEYGVRRSSSGELSAWLWVHRQAAGIAIRRGVGAIGRTMKGGDGMRQDWIFALRSLRAHAGSHALVVAVIAVGIAGSALAFGMLNEGLLRALPYDRAEELYLFEHVNAEVPATRVSPMDATDLRAGLGWERHLATWSFDPRNSVATVATDGGPLPALRAWVDGAFFEVLGTQAALGRTLGPDDDRVGEEPTAVLSHAAWLRLFGGDASVVGRTVPVDGLTWRVVGVLPPDFAFPSPEADLYASAVHLTEDMVPNRRDVRYREAILRVPAGSTPERETESAEALLRALEAEHPEANEGWTGVRLTPLREHLVAGYRDGVLFLTAITLLLLLVVASAVGALQTARTSARGRELAVRMSLGADRLRLARQLMFESLTIAAVGGGAGMMLVTLLAPAASDFTRATLGFAAEIRPDAAVAGFTALVALLTGVSFGIIPAIGVLRAPPGAFLGGARAGVGAFRRGLRTLVVVETAVAMALLVGTGLMLRSFQALVDVDPGFDSADVWSLRYSLAMEGDAAQLAADRDRVVQIARDVSGVRAAGGSKTGLLEGGGEGYTFTIDRAGGAPAEAMPEAGTLLVLPGFFEALGARFVSGAPFTTADPGSSVVVNRTFAERWWPGEDPVGRSLGLGGMRFTVTGVVEPLHATGLTDGPAGAVYANASSFPRLSLFVFVRTEPGVAIEGVQRAIAVEFPEMAVLESRRVTDLLDAQIARPRWLARVVTGFGGLALLLAALGIYGVIAQSVERRRGEIAVRIALGARPGRVVGEQIRSGLMLLVVGTAIGAIGAFGLGRIASTLLFGVRSSDPLAFGTAAVVVLLAGAIAAFLPAFRASRVDPARVLREE